MAHLNKPPADVADLYITVQNTSGTMRYFGFLPPHGRWLAPYQKFSVMGNFMDHLKPLARQALARALSSGDLAILQTPSVYVQDADTGDVKKVAWDSSTYADQPVLMDPSWGNFYSSSEA